MKLKQSRKLLLLLMFSILLVGTVSAVDFDNKLTYENNNLKVTFENTILGIPFLPIGEIGTATLSSHKSIDEWKPVGYGKNVVMWYDFNFNDLYQNGLGDIKIINIKNGKEINKEFNFVYAITKLRNIYGDGNCIKLINGSIDCEQVVVGTETYDEWLPYNSRDVPKGNIRIGVEIFVDYDDKLDLIWTIVGKEVTKHAVVYQTLDLKDKDNDGGSVGGIYGVKVSIKNNCTLANVTIHSTSTATKVYLYLRTGIATGNLITTANVVGGAGGTATFTANATMNTSNQYFILAGNDGVGYIRTYYTAGNPNWTIVSGTDISGIGSVLFETGEFVDWLPNIRFIYTLTGSLTTTPSITLINPTENEKILSNSVILATIPKDLDNATGLNVTIYTNVTGGWTINQSNISSYNDTQTNFTIALPEGVYLWNALVSDGLTSSWGVNRTFSITKVAYTNELSYTTPIQESTTTTFKQNFTIALGYSIPAINITYNQTNYSASFSSANASYYQATATLTTPIVATDTNMTFNWTVLFNDSSLHISSSSLQLVKNFIIDNCSNNTIQIMNLTLVDEDEQNVLNATTYNVSIKVDLDFYTNPAQTILLAQYSHLFNQTNTSRICINTSLGLTTLYEKGQIEYSAGIYANEFYYIQNYSLNSTSNPLKNITLYDLLSANSQIFTINVKDSSYLVLKDAIIEIHRKYVDEGIYKIIEIPYTDGTGSTLAHLVTNDAIYNFIIKKYGVTIASILEKRVVCQNPTLTECVINFNAFATGITVPDYQTLGDFNFTLDYNKSARTISSTFLIPSGTIATVLLNVTREDALGTSVCTDTAISAGTTLTCVIPSNFGNATVLALLYKDGNFVAKGGIALDQDPADIYGGTLVILSLFLMLTLIGASMSDNPIYTVIFFMVGVIMLFALNLVKNNGFVGATATILWLIVAIVIVIIKGANRS